MEHIRHISDITHRNHYDAGVRAGRKRCLARLHQLRRYLLTHNSGDQLAFIDDGVRRCIVVLGGRVSR